MIPIKEITALNNYAFTGVAQWLERRSLTAELSLIYARSMIDM